MRDGLTPWARTWCKGAKIVSTIEIHYKDYHQFETAIMGRTIAIFGTAANLAEAMEMHQKAVKSCGGVSLLNFFWGDRI